MAQAAFLDGERFDLLPPFDDGLVASKVDVSRRQIVDALVVPAVVGVTHEGSDLPFEVAGQEVVFEQYAVFQRLVPALNLALGLGMVDRGSDGRHADCCPACWFAASRREQRPCRAGELCLRRCSIGLWSLYGDSWRLRSKEALPSMITSIMMASAAAASLRLIAWESLRWLA